MGVKVVQTVLTPEPGVPYQIERRAEDSACDCAFEIVGICLCTKKQTAIDESRIEPMTCEQVAEHGIIRDIPVFGPDGPQDAMDKFTKISAAAGLGCYDRIG